jgi:NADH:ubiquinone oxidoreductase subunit E
MTSDKRGEKKEKKLIQYEFIAQAENNPNGYFIIKYCDGRNCELKGFVNL